ncbi:MAG: GNAT family N-acetyltransferase [Pseudomonadota bacterium]
MIDTSDTFIRKVLSRDEREFVALMRASRHLHEPWITPPTNPTYFRHYLQRINREDHEGFAICRKSDEAITGVININNIVRSSFLSASLGYYVGAPFQGHGYMSKGLSLLLRYATNTLGLHRIEANIQPGNARSIALVKRCGFVKEGYSKNFLYLDGAWRDHERWCYIDPRTTLRVQ